jgi:phage terminase large subunit
MYLYKELYVTRRLVEDLAAEIIKLSGKDEFEATISDHDAEDRATLDRHGIYTVPAIKNVLDGVNATKERMKVQADKKPRIFIFRNSLVAQDPLLMDEGKPTSLIDELPGYSWPKSNDQRAVKDAPVKLNDHSCDTLRYAVQYVDYGPTWYFA